MCNSLFVVYSGVSTLKASGHAGLATPGVSVASAVKSVKEKQKLYSEARKQRFADLRGKVSLVREY